MPFNFTPYDRRAFIQNEQRTAELKKLFDAVAAKAVRILLSSGVVLNPDKPFSFNQYPQARKKINELFSSMAKNLKVSLNASTLEAWTLANAKNDKLLDYLHKSTGIDKNILAGKKFGSRNNEALRVFQNRKVNGMNLSDRVWRIAQQSKIDIEHAIDFGLAEGKSANELSRDVRKNLINPTARFKKGSEAWKNYHPGQGVYRSAFKNAQRMARTEINMAYRESDHLRWQSMDAVIGIEIRLSNNPNHCDMCAILVGRYPKNFKFTGWHPNCRCFAIPILMDMDKYAELELAKLNNEEYVPDSDMIADIPNNMKRWMSQNIDRIDRAKSLPYFIRDNKKILSEVDMVKHIPENFSEYKTKLGNLKINDEIFSFLKNPVKFEHHGSSGAYFDLKNSTVVIPVDARRRASKWMSESVVYHEFGHVIDEHHGILKMPEIAKIMKDYKAKFSENENELFYNIDKRLENLGRYAYKKGWMDLMEKTGAAHDTLMSLNPKFGMGHSAAYWRVKGNQEREFIAHMFENKYAGNEVFKKVMPELYDDMIQTLNKILGNIK